MKRIRKTQATLDLPTLKLEGGLFLPDQLEKAAQGRASACPMKASTNHKALTSANCTAATRWSACWRSTCWKMHSAANVRWLPVVLPR